MARTSQGIAEQSGTERLVAATASAANAAFGLWIGLWVVDAADSIDPGEAVLVVLFLAIADAVAQPILRGLASRGGALLALLLGIVGQIGLVILIAYFVVGIELTNVSEIIVVACVMGVITALGRWVVGASDEAYVVGHALRHQRQGSEQNRSDRGLVVIQLDGVSAGVLKRAIASGQAPNLQRWIAGETHTLREWWVPVPSTTPASQAGILHGNDTEVPGFRFWDRELKKLLVSNKPEDAALIESRMTGEGLLRAGGVAISTAFAGGADDSYLVFSRARARRGLGSGAAFIPLFASPFMLPRTLVLTVGEMAKEVWQARRQRTRHVQPRIKRAWSYVALRGLTNVLLRTTNLVLVTDSMNRGVPIVFVDFVDYDEIAHHAGPERPESMSSLAGLDQVVGELERAAHQVGTDYEFVVWSDHGQSLGETFEQLHGATLSDRVTELMSDPTIRSVERPSGEAWGPVNAVLASSLGKERALELGPDSADADDDFNEADQHRPEVIVVGGGNLGMVWFPEIESRPTWEQVERRWPGLVSGLASTEGVAVVMVATDDGSTVAVGPAGVKNLHSGEVQGRDPLSAFGHRAAGDLAHLSKNKHCGDLVLLSTVDELGMVHAFEEQVGSHGGIGGMQNYGIFMHPSALDADDELMTDDQEMGMVFTSPVAIHQQIQRWRQRQGTLPTE